MTYPPYLREKARKLRADSSLTIDEIAQRLAISRTTVYDWVRDMPRPRRCIRASNPPPAELGTRAMQAKYKRDRDEAYELGSREFERLCREPFFREFVCLYIAEGYKRSRNTVSLANSDPAAIALAIHWIRRVSRKELIFSIQYHEDQNLDRLRDFWAAELGISDMQIRFQRKTNSGRLGHRTWRSAHGVLTVLVHDTYCRLRLQGWIDCIRGQWLDSIRIGA